MAASLLVAGWNPKVLLIDRIGTSEDGLIYLVSYRYVFRCLQCLESITVVAQQLPQRPCAPAQLSRGAAATHGLVHKR